MRRQLFVVMGLLVVISIVAAQCVVPTPPGTAPVTTPKYKLAVILPGVTTDADYNTLGYLGGLAVQKDLGVEMAYSESVAVPDVERVMREYIDNGYNIIFTHGSQFVSQTKDLATQFPDVYFIGEGDAPMEDAPKNMWVMDRNFYIPFYAIGAVAAKQTQTGKIGYIGGLTLPFSYSEVHAAQQAIDDLGLDVELKPVWVGDFNDPTKAREITDAMIAENVDVIMGSLNLGMFGLFEAVKSAPEQVLATAKYVDKSSFAPDNYITAALYDWEKPLKDIVQKIMAGETGGYYPMGFATGVAIQMPLRNVSDELNGEIEQIIADIQSGKIEVVKDTTPIE
jgi:basic membrane protein A